MCPGATGTPLPCSAGGFCAGKDAFAAPCPAGTWSNVTGLASKKDCKPCDAGSSCRAGSTAPQKCAAGTYSAGADVCEPCAAGSFQPDKGATKCEPCARGSYCPEGSSRPAPCPAGTYGGSTGLGSADECTKVDPGYYSSLGAADPEPCPVDADDKPIDAFYCPGWEADTEFRGSKPLLVPTGQRLVTETATEVSASASFDAASFNETRAKAEFAAAVGAAAEDVAAEVVEAIRVEFVLDQEAGDFDEEEFRGVLAKEAGVDVSQIEVRVVAGSVVAEVTIRGASAAFVEVLEGGDTEDALQAALGADVSRQGDVTTTVERVAQVTLSTSADAARSSAGTPIELTGAISAVEAELVNVEVKRRADCPSGYRCLGGEMIPCPPGTRGGGQGEYCVDCAAGTYQEAEAQKVCAPCPEGSYCGVRTASPRACPDGTYGGAEGLAPGQLHRLRPGPLVLGGQSLRVQRGVLQRGEECERAGCVHALPRPVYDGRQRIDVAPCVQVRSEVLCHVRARFR